MKNLADLRLRSRRPVKDRIRYAYKQFRDRLWIETSDQNAQLSNYRQLALQLSRSNSNKGSVLLATPAASLPVASCCALLAGNVASILRKPVLLADISDDGRRMSNLLGLTSEMYCSTDERSRYFSVSGRWYVATREGIPIGPYGSVDEAQCGLNEFISAPDWIKDAKADDFSPQRVILPTYFQNLFFLPPEPARQALLRGSYLDNEEETTAALLQRFHERFSYVIFYGGSIIDNPLMLTIAPHVDTILHAVVENDTKVADLKSAHETLQSCRSGPIPFVLVRASGHSNGTGIAL